MSMPTITGATPTASTGATSTSSGASSGTTSSTPQTTGVNSPPFQIFGLASGLNTAAIIDKLVQVYSAPMQIVQQQEAVTQQKQVAWNDIQSKMQALQTAIQNLQAPAAAAGRVGSITPPSGATSAPFTVSATPAAATGSFTVSNVTLATTGSLAGATGISKPISVTSATTSPLSSAGFGTTPTTGTFTINGTAITVDSATTLLGGVGTDSLQAKLTAAGVALSYATDGSGNLTTVTIANSPASTTPIQLGAPGDTSNVLSALRLTNAVPSTGGGNYSITSNGSLSGVNQSASLGSSGINGVFSGSGAFTINGKSISYSSTDTLGSLIATINSANAGVTAAYDPLGDRLTLTATTTGAGGINVGDPSATGLPAALKLTGAGVVSTAGIPAQLTISGINGGNPIASAANTVAGVIPGVTLNLTATATGTSTVTVAPDTTALTTALQGVVTAYNTMQDTITKYSAVTFAQGSTTPTAPILAGDTTLSGLALQMDNIVNDTTVTVGGQQYSLAALGISTGTPGTYAGGAPPSLDLQFTTSDVASALGTTPGLAQAFVGNGTIASQTGTLFDALNSLTNSWLAPLGVISSAQDALSANYTNEYTQIQTWQTTIQQEHDQLVAQFTSMETTLSQLQAQQQAMAMQFGTTNNSSTSSTGTTTSLG